MNLTALVEKEFIILETELLSNYILINYKSKGSDNWLQNDSLITQQLSSIKGNVYCIFIEKKNENIMPVYVGQRDSHSIRQRLREHLLTKNIQTGSKLEQVKEVVNQGHKVFINTVFIEPEYLRHALEKMIIERHKDKLIWNKHIK
jgi:hypothetical protein